MTHASARFDLRGQAALVLGAAGGLGAAVSTGLADHGAAVALADFRGEEAQALAEQIAAAGGKAAAIACDGRVEADIDRAVRHCRDSFGGLDVVVNLVCSARLCPVLDMPAEQFDETIHSCLRSAFLISQAAGRAMVEQGRGGSVIHVSSIAGSAALGRGTGVYAAAKAGVNALVRELAIEWAPHGIRVNAVAPCQFRTPPLERLLDDPKFGGREALTAKMLANIPLGRLGEPEDLAGPCIFLASRAAAMVTGHVLFVDGGYTAR